MESIEDQILQWLDNYRKTELQKMSSGKNESPLVLFYAGEVIACEKFSKIVDDIIQRCKENRTA